MSSISGLSFSTGSSSTLSLSSLEDASSKKKKVKDSLDTISDDINSGNLTSAQTALTSLEQSMGINTSDSSSTSTSSTGTSSSTTGTSSSSTNNPLATDLKTLSDALKSGDTTTAKSTLEKIQSHMKNGPQGAPPSSDSSDSDTGSTSSTDSTTSSNTFEQELSQLIAYLSNGQANTSTGTSSTYNAQA